VETQSPALKLGPNIVRAWFDTVINPLIAVLETELVLLEKRNFTWQYRPADLEAFRPLARQLDPRFRANLEHFTTFNANFAQAAGSHDRCIGELRQAAAELQTSLINNPDFQEIFEIAISLKSLAPFDKKTPGEVFGAYPKEDWIQVIAQYVVNNTGPLPPHYSTASVWNANRSSFVDLFKMAGVETHYRRLIAFADQLLGIDQNILDLLRCLRLELSSQHDQPFATNGPQSPELWQPFQ
jgi:hypothetical protein